MVPHLEHVAKPMVPSRTRFIQETFSIPLTAWVSSDRQLEQNILPPLTLGRTRNPQAGQGKLWNRTGWGFLAIDTKIGFRYM
jgi:hypothetical protein